MRNVVFDGSSNTVYCNFLLLLFLMKGKLASDDRQSQLDRQWANEYGEKRNRSRRKQNIGLRVNT